jgi:hypothetical protein
MPYHAPGLSPLELSLGGRLVGHLGMRAMVEFDPAPDDPHWTWRRSEPASERVSEPESVSLPELVDRELAEIEALETAKAQLEGKLIDAYAAVHTTLGQLFAGRIDRPRSKVPVEMDTMVGQEIAVATGVGPAEVSRRLWLATSGARHANLRDALRAGRISLYRALQVVTECRDVPDEAQPELEEALLDQLTDKEGSPCSQRAFSSRLGRFARGADPRGQAERRAGARQRRCAYGRIGTDGMGSLTVHAAAERIAAALGRADAVARRARAAGDERTLEQLRSDFMMDTLLFGWPTDTSTDTDTRTDAGTCSPDSHGSSGTSCPTSVTKGAATTGASGSGPAEARAPFRQPEASDDPAELCPECVEFGELDRAVPPERFGEADRPGAPSGEPRPPDGHPADPGPCGGDARQPRPPDRQRDEPGPGDGDAPGAKPTEKGDAGEAFGPGLWLGRPPPAQVWIVVPFEVAAGMSDAPCELPGRGWVTAEHAREIISAPGSVWHQLSVDVDTGYALHLDSRGYRPSAELLAQVRARDGVCRGPGCDVPAHQCDFDHEMEWPEGATTYVNGYSKHRLCHMARTARLWRSEPHGEHGLKWTTLTGREYLTYPKNWLETLQEHLSDDRPVGEPSDSADPADEGVRPGRSDAGVRAAHDIGGSVGDISEDTVEQDATGHGGAGSDRDLPPF